MVSLLWRLPPLQHFAAVIYVNLYTVFLLYIYYMVQYLCR